MYFQNALKEFANIILSSLEDSPEKMLAADQSNAKEPNGRCPCSSSSSIKRPPKIGDLVIRKPTQSKAAKQRIHTTEERRQAGIGTAVGGKLAPLDFKTVGHMEGSVDNF